MNQTLSFFTLSLATLVNLNQTSPRILIIGSGASGIAAGTKLIENNFKNIVILEAESRIGGRIFTTPFGENVVDLGAQWCHGEENNVVYEMAHPLDLLESSTNSYENHLFIFSNGETLDTEVSSKLLELCPKIAEVGKIGNYSGSLGHFAVEEFYKIMNENYFSTNISAETAEMFLNFCHKYNNGEYASDSWFDLSAQGTTHYEESAGDYLLAWKGKGYKTILDVLMKKIPDPSKDVQLEKMVRLNKAVKNVDWSRDDEKVMITCEDGDIFEADHVISTVSLGVLKEKQESLFTPGLPQRKLDAIQAFKIGTVDKMYLEFSEPFWDKNWTGFTILWTPKELEEIQKRKYSWIQDIVGFLTVDYQPNLLCGWIMGPKAREMESIPETKVLRSAMYLLRMFLKKNIPEPVRFKRTTWFSNRNFRGSYSYPTLAVDSLNVTNSDLATPVFDKNGKPVILFAGEATSSNHYATVHGAIETGWREAKRIIDSYQ